MTAIEDRTLSIPKVGPMVEPGETLLSCRGVDVSYGPVQVLFGVDLEVAEGEIVALLGTNGAGKSTLLKAVCGLLKHSAGDIRLGPKAVPSTADAAAKAGIVLMPGGKGVFPTLTVSDNLRLAGWLLRRDRKQRSKVRQEVLDIFPRLKDRMHTLAGDLSGGEQQQLALAQAFSLRPRLLLIDELSLGLAPTIVSMLLDIVRNIHASGVTVVVVEQSVNVALHLAERAVFMEKGEVRFEGPTADLLDRPDVLRSVFIAGAAAGMGADDGSPSDAPSGAAKEKADAGWGEVERRPAAALDKAAGGSAEAKDPSEPQPPLPPLGTGLSTSGAASTNGSKAAGVLECHGVTKRFGGITAVDSVDMVLKDGAILGLIGQNGAGKTTLLDCLSGFLQVDGGRVLLRGHDVTEWAPHERATARLGRSFQEARLYPSLSVGESIAVSLERHVASQSMLADALHLPASYEAELTTWAKVDELVSLMGLGDYREKLTGELSTGTRRIVELACILAHEPLVLLLDEPSAGVAQRETEALGPLLRRVRDHTGCSIVVIEHDMPLLSAISDEMIALELGAVIARGDPDTVLHDPRVIESYLGTDSAAVERSSLPRASAPSGAH